MGSLIDTSTAQRLQQARRRLAMARQRLRRVALLAHAPNDLDADLPLLSRPAFMRRLLRCQLQPEEGARTCALLLIDIAGADADLLRAIAWLLLENTRGCDIIGRIDEARFAILLKGAAKPDAARIARRLKAKLHELAAQRHVFLRIHAIATQLDASRWPDALIRDLVAQLPRPPLQSPPSRPTLSPHIS